jgi:outer membrane protein OmpA-like peptidoglycan-associated protein/tetratricopeptide (TPR) repeat protein
MRRFTLIVIAVLISSLAFPQKGMLKRADKKYNQLAYADAIPLYEYALKRDSMNTSAIRKLADSYRLTGNSIHAEKWYGKLVTKDSLAITKFYYGEALFRNGKYEEAKKYLTHPALASLNEPRVQSYLLSLKQLNDLRYSDTANVKVYKLKFNSKETDFSPALYKNGFVFSSSRRRESMVKRDHSWTDEKFVSLFFATYGDDYKEADKFATELESKFNNGPVVFRKGETQMYYTVNNPKGKSENDVKDLKIEMADYKNNRWVKTTEFAYNSNEYACAHPALSEDGQSFCFSSNMPGGYGGMDLYMCKMNPDMTWSKPVNMGPVVNSPGDDVFPVFFKNEKIFFASTGHGGLGGLDIYEFQLNGKEIKNVGAPINSHEDDFGLVMYDDQAKGFFSSNRGNEGINDDIYSFERIRPKERDFVINVIDSVTGQLITTSAIKLTGANLLQPLIGNASTGRFTFQLAPDKTFMLNASAENYLAKNVTYITSTENQVFTVKLAKLKTGCIVQGTLTDKVTGAKLDSVLLTINDKLNDKIVFQAYTDKNGFYKFDGLKANTFYEIKASKTGYFAGENDLSTKGATCITTKVRDYDYIRDIPLEKIEIGKAIKIENIYFDLNKWSIRKDAAVELDKIVNVMNENPDIVIELSSHTDSRGSDESNMILSDKRAKSSAAYIVSKGVADNRITGKGYGETMLVNQCGNAIKCTEVEHQQNRRTEFKVTGFLSK